MIPRIPSWVSYLAAIAALLVVPYYYLANQPKAALSMLALAFLNYVSSWKASL